jgi:hypothetical protein
MHGKRMLIELAVLFKPLLGEASLYRHTAAEARRPRWIAPGDEFGAVAIFVDQ